MLLLSLLVACGPTEDTEVPFEPDLYVAPDAGGWYDAGTEVDQVTARGGTVLPAQFWYPTTDPGAEVRCDGMTPGSAFTDSAPMCDTPRPVIGFSHGNGGLRYQSIFFTELAARRGFVVFAPDHIGNTAFDLGDVPTDEAAVRRPTDMADTFDHLVARGEDPADELFGCVDGDAGYAMVGHSFGGYTTFATAGAPLDLIGMAERCPDVGWLCGAEQVWAEQHPDDGSGDLSDSRVWAGVPWAPAGRWALLTDQIDVPMLVIGGEDDITTPLNYTVAPMFAELTVTPRYLAAIDQVGHYSFTDFCLVADDGCGDAFLPLDEAQDLISSLTIAFIEAQSGEARSAAFLPPEHDALTWTAVE